MAAIEQASAEKQAQAGLDRATEARREEVRAAFESAEPSYGAAYRVGEIGKGVADGVENVATGMVGAVAHTANSLIDGVGSVGDHAIHTATHLLTEAVGGVRQVVGAAFSGLRLGGMGGAPQPGGGQDMKPADAPVETRR